MRFALLSDLEAIPWVPLIAGIAEGLASHGHEIEHVFVSTWPTLPLWQLGQRAPDLALVFAHNANRAHIGRYLLRLAELGVPRILFAYDDPYDHATGLDVGQFCDLVLTPEPGTVAHYLEAGLPAEHLGVCVSDSMHRTERRPATWDLLWIGGTWWTPRNAILPRVQRWCQGRGLRYAEVGGRSRWVVGSDLADAWAQTAITLEIPRYDLPTRTNPHQVPCSWTGPRVHLAAATGTPCLIVNAKPDQAYPMFPRCVPETVIDELARLLDPDAAATRRLIGQRARAEFEQQHHPRLVTRRLLDIIAARGWCGGAAGRAPAAAR